MNHLDQHERTLEDSGFTLNSLALAMLQATYTAEKIKKITELNSQNILINLRQEIHKIDEEICFLFIDIIRRYEYIYQSFWNLNDLVECYKDEADPRDYNTFFLKITNLLRDRFQLVYKVWEIKKKKWEQAHNGWVWEDKITRLQEYASQQWFDNSKWDFFIALFGAIHEEAIRIEQKIIDWDWEE